MNESDILKKVMLSLGTKHWIKLWRNNTGSAWQGQRYNLKRGLKLTTTSGKSFITETGDILLRHAHPVKFGLIGSGDIAGIIYPNGKTIYIETKYGKYKQTTYQKNFEKMIKAMGGIYIVVKDPDNVEQQILNEMGAKDAQL